MEDGENEEKGLRFKNLLILETEREKIITLDKEKFTILAPKPSDHNQMARISAIQKNGIPDTSFSLDDQYRFNRFSALKVLIREHPKWWDGPDSSLSEDYSDRLFTKITEWDDEFQESLKKNRLGKVVQ